ncbi:hypothetical protein [Massilia sp. X63]|uniref:hypothetical protein n=1 Tax=Massilia sp. X63 TaxID=3237285 RepID=UPI0034DD64EF
MTQYFVDEQGRYLGGFDGAEPPEGAIEVPHPPADARMVWDGEQFGAAPAPEAQIVAGYMAEVQRHMDAKAVSYGYDNLLSVITYAEAPEVERYQVEGQAFRAWRSLCWAKCEQVLAEFKAGERAEPSYAELIAEMPELGLGAPAHFAA